MDIQTPVYSAGYFLPAKSPITWREPKTRTHRGTYDSHLRAIDKYCKSKATVYENESDNYNTVKLHANHCNSWDCEECRIRKASILKSRVKAGITKQSWRLLTLTLDPKRISLTASLQNFSQLWDVFLKRVKRLCPDLQYIKVVEFQESGYPHIHVIINKYIFHVIIRQIWTELGGGSIVDIRPIRTKQIANYICGYLSQDRNKHAKHNHQFYDYSLRRFSFSRNFPIKPWEKRTTIYCSDIDWLDGINVYNEVCNIISSENVFIAVRTKNYMKYINLYNDHSLIKKC